MAKLIKEYTSGSNQMDKLRRSLDSGNEADKEDAKIVSGMVSDMRYALEWMRHGRRPGNRRGADRTDIYRQRELLEELRPIQIDEAERDKLVRVLLTLTERERTCFLLHMAQGLTYSEIASNLKLSIRSIRSYVDRAKDKVKREVSA
ncbi:sigma factor-like helix-turn-helix DNA-binding protein [Paenibacillus sp. MY03]|uniref:sigma factor-like helix-turn-helix DNA-binding protein n=1 Tax=Paenibacillus sp. MY03 TaxID=302980 RepID=UPI00211B169C|nr:sigma factor-like helix-turn-helix DNA-binding protein [Paenibacillus sp. MY03]